MPKPPEPAASGAKPSGAVNEIDAATAVRAMFDEIAPRYDLLNHVLSMNIDRLWWRRTARRFRAILAKPHARVLDICCGTGDMTLALLRLRPRAATPIVAADFSHAMLLRGQHKFANRDAIAVEADAMQLPLSSGSINLITTAFGFRNLSNYRRGLEEFLRVLAPGGSLGILDFAEPGGSLGKLYSFYFRRVLPRIGKRLSGSASSYSYLPASVKRFPAPPELMSLMREVGYTDISWKPYTFGIAGLYTARKAD